MTSQKKQRSNRRNSKLSTGPRTPQGKANSRLNATKHGLSIPIEEIPDYKDRLGRLTAALQIELCDDSCTQEIARLAAAHLELERVRRRRAELIDLAALDLKENHYFYREQIGGNRAAFLPFTKRLKDKDFLAIAAHELRFGGRDISHFNAAAYMHALVVLRSVERYESRAFSARMRALRQLLDKAACASA